MTTARAGAVQASKRLLESLSSCFPRMFGPDAIKHPDMSTAQYAYEELERALTSTTLQDEFNDKLSQISSMASLLDSLIGLVKRGDLRLDVGGPLIIDQAKTLSSSLELRILELCASTGAGLGEGKHE